MAKQKQKETNVGTPASEHTEIVYRKSSPQGNKERTMSFTITEAQAEWVKNHRKEINFSQTMRNYLDSVIATYNAQPNKEQ